MQRANNSFFACAVTAALTQTKGHTLVAGFLRPYYSKGPMQGCTLARGRIRLGVKNPDGRYRSPNNIRRGPFSLTGKRHPPPPTFTLNCILHPIASGPFLLRSSGPSACHRFPLLFYGGRSGLAPYPLHFSSKGRGRGAPLPFLSPVNRPHPTNAGG